MKPTFLISCAALFLGGVLLLIFSSAVYDVFRLLGLFFALMGGIPVILCWFRELFALLPDEKAQKEHIENSNEEDN